MLSPLADVISRSLLYFSPSTPPPVSLPLPFLDVWTSEGLPWEVRGLDGAPLAGGSLEWEWEKQCFQGWTLLPRVKQFCRRPFRWCIITIKGVGHGGKVLFLSCDRANSVRTTVQQPYCRCGWVRCCSFCDAKCLSSLNCLQSCVDSHCSDV